MERLFGPAIVFPLITPEIVLTCLRNFKDLPQLRRLREPLPVSFRKDISDLGHFLRMFRVWISSLAIALFYDRLDSPAWRRRIAVRGNPPNRLPGWDRQPVVVAFFHTGGFPILRYWLRAHGVPAALYLNTLPRVARHAQKLRDHADQTLGLTGIPHHFSGGESLREAVRFLQPGRTLLIALEERDFRKPPELYTVNGLSIGLNRVAFRLALLSGALLMAAAVRECGPCRFEITFSPPVPARLMHDDGLVPANQYLLGQLGPGMENDPASLTWTTLEAISPHLIRKRGTWP
jgi:hypothetical protein